MTTKIETVILQNLINDDEYMRKVIPFLKRDYFIDNNEKIIYDRIKDFIDLLIPALLINTLVDGEVAPASDKANDIVLVVVVPAAIVSQDAVVVSVPIVIL